jgi:hypothetical protein
MIAALFVEKRGIYSGRPDVEVWHQGRDARLYAGPWPVVAHPPCERWGRYWSGGPMLARTPKAKEKGDDGGCFAAALASVRRWGGVLEHPEASHAWRAHGLLAPRLGFGWEPAGDFIGWTCRVEQGHFGHRARKATWLYASRVCLPVLPWGSSGKRARLDDGCHTSAERRERAFVSPLERLSRLECLATPAAFAELLLAIAGSAALEAQS